MLVRKAIQYTVDPPLTVTSLQRPFFLADIPYIHPCFKLSTTVTSLRRPFFFVGQSTHSPLFQPLYNGHLSTTAIFFWRTVHTFTLVSTSPQWTPFYNGHFFWRTVHTFTLVSAFLQWTPLYIGHFFCGQSVHSPLFQTLYNDHFFWRTVHTSILVSAFLQWTPLYNGHFFWRTVRTFTLVSSSLQWPFFLADSPYIHPCFSLSTMNTFVHRPFFLRTVRTFTLVSNSLQRPFFFGGQSIHSLLFQPL